MFTEPKLSFAGRRPIQFILLRFLVWVISFAILGAPRGVQAFAANPTPPANSHLMDPETKKGFQHFYDLEYDQSIADFERVANAHPDDPFAQNHLLSALIFRELYRADALDTTQYASRGNGFLNNKTVVPVDKKTKARIQQVVAKATELADRRLQANPEDVNALFARGITRGLKTTYMAMVEKGWFAALRNAIGARRDHERVLELDPGYTDAKTVVGAHNYVVGSLPLPVKMMAGVVGLGGNKEKGISYLYDAANAGGETSVDAKIALGLFLRREGRYSDALALARNLTALHPRNFLFSLEVANLLKDSGQPQPAIDAYQKLIADSHKGAYPSPHLDLAYFGLGDTYRGQKNYQRAFDAYNSVTLQPATQSEVQRRCVLAAGEMLDLLRKRALARQKYEVVVAADPNSPQAETARKLLKAPYEAE